MKTIPTLVLLLLAFVSVFLEATWDWPRRWLGGQVDLLPALMVCCAMTVGVWEVAGLAVLGGLLLDSLSANSLGVSVLPLFWTGFVLSRLQDLLLRDLTYAQAVLGGLATGVVFLLKLGILLSLGETPLISWNSVWAFMVSCAIGAILTPPIFWVVAGISSVLSYQPASTLSFRPDREIKRGRQ